MSADTFNLRADADGTLFTVKVQPGAGHTSLAGVWEGAFKVKVGKKPEQGAANRECLEFLAACLQVPRRAVALRQGEKAHVKVIHVDGLTPLQVQERLQRFVK